MSQMTTRNMRMSFFIALILSTIIKCLISYLEEGKFKYTVILIFITQILFAISAFFFLFLVIPETPDYLVAIISTLFGILFAGSEAIDIVFYVLYNIHDFLGIYIFVSIIKLCAMGGLSIYQCIYYSDLEFN